MPYKSEKYSIKELGGKDKRVKLTPQQKEQIKQEWEPDVQSGRYNKGSIHSLALKYGVSRRLISSIVREKPIPQNTYDKKKHQASASNEARRKYKQRYRKRKQCLYLQAIKEV